MTQDLTNRIAVIRRLVEKAPNQVLGRTGIMKFCYFLEVLRDVQLDYRFTLYSYGPFDSAVLQDLDLASHMGAVTIGRAIYPSGYGYEIRPAAGEHPEEEPAAAFVAQHEADIDWVIQEFGRLTAAELELLSTVVYVDREAVARVSKQDLTRRVKEVKPHFTTDRILAAIEDMCNKRLLRSCN